MLFDPEKVKPKNREIRMTQECAISPRRSAAETLSLSKGACRMGKKREKRTHPCGRRTRSSACALVLVGVALAERGRT